MADNRTHIYEGTNREGWIEHDCMNPDCYTSFDVKGEYVDQCPMCGSTDLVTREGFNVKYNSLFASKHDSYTDGEHGMSEYHSRASDVQDSRCGYESSQDLKPMVYPSGKLGRNNHRY